MAADPITAGLDAVTAIVSRIWPDKTESEKAQLAAAVQMVSAQTNIDQAEAQSTDPLQHWRGGLGWVCVAAYLNNFVLVPWAQAFHLTVPLLNVESLSTLTLGMLGLGGMHVYQQVSK